MATNKVITNSTSVTLAWDAVSGANQYHLQVSEFPDFRTLMINDNLLGSATKAFTDTGDDDTKRWWRFRSSANGGSTWGVWSEVGHYWLMAGATEFTTPSIENFYFVSEATTERLTILPFPRWSILQEKLPRARLRNRAGELLSEYLTIKETIVLDFPDSNFIDLPDVAREIQRFNVELKTFFLVAYKDNDAQANVPHIWKVDFAEDPSFDMLAPGTYKKTTSLRLEEV